MKPTCAALALCTWVAAASAQPAALAVSDICPDFNEVMSHSAVPPEALKKGIASGDVTITFTLTPDNRATDIVATGATHPILENWAIGVVKRLHCSSGGREQRLSIPFSYRLDMGSSYATTQEDIPDSRLREVVPLIAELKVTPESFDLKVGDGVKIDAMKVMAYDRDGKFLGRLRQFDRGAKPHNVITMRGAGVAQAVSAGVGYLELAVPSTIWERRKGSGQRPTVRVPVTVSE
jgi:hypothetical protein